MAKKTLTQQARELLDTAGYSLTLYQALNQQEYQPEIGYTNAVMDAAGATDYSLARAILRLVRKR